jgi:Fe-S-cluster containining protein
MVISLKAKKQIYCSQICKAWCCKNLITYYSSDDPEIDTFFKLHGIDYNPETKQMIIPLKCKWLTNQNKCKLYAWRPYSCRAYECDKVKAITLNS